MPGYEARLRSALLENTHNKYYEWDAQEFSIWLHAWKKSADATIRKRVASINRMARHPIVPLKVSGTAADLVISFFEHVEYRASFEKAETTALSNDWKAVKLLGAFRQIPSDAWPTCGAVPRRAKELLPSPEQVKAMLQPTYARQPRDYVNHLVRGLVVASYGLGLRSPSELYALRVQDVERDLPLVLVTEPKKRGSTRNLYVEPATIVQGLTRPSLRNYIRWRDKVDVGGTDALFLRPSGEPFASKDALRRWMNVHIRPHHPGFTPYQGRRWSHNARLIDWDFDYDRVAKFHGHESTNMVRLHYEQDAQIHKRLYGGDWLARFAGKARKTETRATTPVSGAANRSGGKRTERGPAGSPGERTPETKRDDAVSGSSPSSPSPLPAVRRLRPRRGFRCPMKTPSRGWVGGRAA